MTVVIEHRYRGPPDSANGGYAAGVLGSKLDAASALHAESGELLAIASATWIELK